MRELAKQGVKLPDQVQRFLLLRRANLTTQARIASLTLAGNSLSFTDVRKTCIRYAAEFLRDLKETESYNSHTVYVSQAKETRTVTDNSEQETEDSDVETGLAALSEGDSADLEETNVQDIP